MIRRPPRSTHCISSAASDVYKRQVQRYLVPTHASVVCRDPSECSFRSLTCHSMSSRGLYSLPVWLSDPTPRDNRAAVADVEMACTLHRVLLLSGGSLYSPKRASPHRLGRTLMQPLLDRMRPLRPSAGVVRNDPARRSCCRCFEGLGLYPLP